MNIVLKVIVPVIALIGCDVYEPVSTSILLTDTTGRETAIFYEREHFDVRFAVTNNTDEKMTFTRSTSAPDIQFSVYQGDSLVSSSTDGFAFLMVSTTASLGSGQSLRGHWRGPTTAAQHPKVSLTPGEYILVVSFPAFNGLQTITVPPKKFSIRTASN